VRRAREVSAPARIGRPKRNFSTLLGRKRPGPRRTASRFSRNLVVATHACILRIEMLA